MTEITISGTREILGKELTVYSDSEQQLFRSTDVAGLVGAEDVKQMLEPVDETDIVRRKVTAHRDGLLPLSITEVYLTEQGLYAAGLLSEKRPQLLRDFRDGKLTSLPRRALLNQVAGILDAVQESIRQQQADLDDILRNLSG